MFWRLNNFYKMSKVEKLGAILKSRNNILFKELAGSSFCVPVWLNIKQLHRIGDHLCALENIIKYNFITTN